MVSDCKIFHEFTESDAFQFEENKSDSHGEPDLPLVNIDQELKAQNEDPQREKQFLQENYNQYLPKSDCNT